MVLGFTTTYAISAYHNQRCEFESHIVEVYSIQHFYKSLIKFVSDCRWFSPGTPIFWIFLLFVHIIRLFYRQVCFISKGLVDVQVNNKICSCHNIAEILLKLVSNTNQSINQSIDIHFLSVEIYMCYWNHCTLSKNL
jgi:hypothetical protein